MTYQVNRKTPKHKAATICAGIPSCLIVATCEPTGLVLLSPVLPTLLCRKPSDSFSLIVALSFSISALAAARSLCKLSEPVEADVAAPVDDIALSEARPTEAAALEAAFDTVLAAFEAAALSSEVLVGTPAACSFSTAVAGAVSGAVNDRSLDASTASPPVAGADRSAKAEDGAVWRPSASPLVNLENVLSAAKNAD